MLSPLAYPAPGAVRCDQLLDVRSGQMLSDQLVVFDASATITSVSTSSSTKLPNGATAIDLSNATYLPGLVDVHTHLTADPSSQGHQPGTAQFNSKRSSPLSKRSINSPAKSPLTLTARKPSKTPCGLASIPSSTPA